ncbi:MAG: phage major capsid protein [Methylococcales bacterium]|nr:phage major capsid protein [Methylococcales bacterium]
MTDIIEIKTAVEQLNQANADFQKKFEEKFNALDKEVLNIQKKANRIPTPGTVGSSSDLVESKNDLATFIRSRGEIKAMSVGTGPEGGWTVNPVLQDGIGTLVRNNSALRELVTFIEIETGDAFEELVSVTPAGASWTGETSARTATDAPELAKIKTPLLELYAAPTLSQRLADDSGTNMVDFLVNEVGISFSEAEETALFLGSNPTEPRGLATIPTAATADATRPFGTIQHIATGASGALDSTDPLNKVKELFFSLKAGYRNNAKWVCSSATALLLSQQQDGQGNYLWDQGDIKTGQPVTLLGKPVVICETCPTVAANSLSLWFGDWNQAIRGIERPGNRLLLDPYSDKPNLVVYVYRRVGFGLRNSNAIKVLKFAAA